MLSQSELDMLNRIIREIDALAENFELTQEELSALLEDLERTPESQPRADIMRR